MVSIIIPVYNLEAYLEECLNSVLKQTYRDIEVIVVNDGSSDTSQDIIDSFSLKDNRVKSLYKENGGLTSARNYGLAHATGEWILHLDGDDWLNETAVERFIDAASQTNADLVIGGLNFVWSDHSEKFEPVCCNKDFNLYEYISSIWTTLCGSMQNKSLYDDFALKSPESISYCEDFHLMVRLCNYSNKVICINDCNYNYRQRGTSIIHALNAKTESDELWAYNDIWLFLQKVNKADQLTPPMAWRALKAAQEMLLNPDRHIQFNEYLPWKKDYILSCPFYNLTQKSIAWSLTHHMPFVAKSITKLRNWLRNK